MSLCSYNVCTSTSLWAQVWISQVTVTALSQAIVSRIHHFSLGVLGQYVHFGNIFFCWHVGYHVMMKTIKIIFKKGSRPPTAHPLSSLVFWHWCCLASLPSTTLDKSDVSGSGSLCKRAGAQFSFSMLSHWCLKWLVTYFLESLICVTCTHKCACVCANMNTTWSLSLLHSLRGGLRHLFLQIDLGMTWALRWLESVKLISWTPGTPYF